MSQVTKQTSSENDKLEQSRRVIREARVAAEEAAEIRKFHTSQWSQRKAAQQNLTNSWRQR